jgi:single-stranded-DNA-specific exonuclease
VLGPAINAGGRLDTAALAENLLLREELDGETMKQAEALKTLNDSRKTMTVENTEAAIAMVDESALTKDPVLVVYLPECGESIAGIVAGRLREHYYKPSIVLTDAAGEEGMAKGSGRSIPGYEMFQELERVGDLLTRFGGHPMAAGLSLKKEHISEFRRRLNANCTLTAAQLKERLWIDIPLPVSKISIAWIEELHQLEPFGKGNEKPLFADKDLQIRRGMILGKDRNVLKLQLESVDGCAMEALIFHEKDAFLEEFEACYGSEALEQLYRGFDRSDNPTCMSMVYEPSVNDYRGVQTVQVIIEDFHLHQKNENV